MQRRLVCNVGVGAAMSIVLLAGSPTIAAARTQHDASPAQLNRLIASHARRQGVPVALATAVVRLESNYNPQARGAAGEIGLMQIKPATARGIGFTGKTPALYDPDTNLKWGMRYLGAAYKLAGGSVCGTILRYNAGHYAKRMNPVSRRYCNKVLALMGKSGKGDDAS